MKMKTVLLSFFSHHRRRLLLLYFQLSSRLIFCRHRCSSASFISAPFHLFGKVVVSFHCDWNRDEDVNACDLCIRELRLLSHRFPSWSLPRYFWVFTRVRGHMIQMLKWNEIVEILSVQLSTPLFSRQKKNKTKNALPNAMSLCENKEREREGRRDWHVWVHGIHASCTPHNSE